ncbi:MAG: hypothetical protein GY826_13615, partial [Fuerstiella sp.]|nr:hypothetical protein [Fuerstiella sp.]
ARGGKWELYNLAEDRTESHDLASDKADLATELSQLWHHVAENVDQAPRNQRKPATNKVQTFPPSAMTERAAGPKPDGKKKRK